MPQWGSKPYDREVSMTETVSPEAQPPLGRRSVLKAAAGLSLGAGMLSGLASAASAQEAKKAPRVRGADGMDKVSISARDYWAKKGEVMLSMYRKRLGAPVA